LMRCYGQIEARSIEAKLVVDRGFLAGGLPDKTIWRC